MFYVSEKAILGQWKRADTGYVYYFISDSILLIRTEKKDISYSYSLEQRGRDNSWLVIDGKKFEFVVMHPEAHFALWVKKGLVDFWYVKDSSK